MHWLNILALIAFFLGLVNGLSGLKSMRSREHPQAEITWRQRALSVWRYERLSMAAITIHSLGLIGLAAVILRSLIHSEVVRFPPVASPPQFFLLALVGVFYTAWKCGIVIGFHLGQFLIRTISYGISNAGLWYGGMLLHWRVFSRYEIGPEDGQISLYSSYSSSLRTWVLQPSPESLVEVLERIQKNLRRAPAFDEPTPWPRSPLSLLFGITILVLGALLPAVWGLRQGLSWIWIYGVAAFLLVGIVGNGLITIFDGRSKRPKPEEQAA